MHCKPTLHYSVNNVLNQLHITSSLIQYGVSNVLIYQLYITSPLLHYGVSNALNQLHITSSMLHYGVYKVLNRYILQANCYIMVPVMYEISYTLKSNCYIISAMPNYSCRVIQAQLYTTNPVIHCCDILQTHVCIKAAI